MRRIERLVGSLAALGGYFSGWLVLVVVVLVFVEVFTRYVLNRPLVLADELSAYMLVALCFIGAAYTWKEKAHVRITALVSLLPAKVASWLRLATLLLVSFFVLGLLQASYVFMATSFRLDIASSTWLRTPLQPIHMLLPIGFVLLGLVVLINIFRAIKHIRAGKSAEEIAEWD